MDIKEYEELDPKEQEKVFHQSPFKEKGDLLLHSHDPVKLARSLSQEELYLVTKEMDLEERSEVIRYANLPQLFFISDIDCWRRDRIDPRGFVNWLETLLLADENRLLAWLLEMDPETVISGFKKVMSVIKPEREYAADELLGDTPYFTLDEMYYICVGEENFEIVKRAVQVLFENARGRYVALVEEMMAELDDIIEEDAFQRREMRLAERGFPDFETARKIYRPLEKDEFENYPLKQIKKKDSFTGAHVRSEIPNYPTLWSPERLFLDEALLLFRDDVTGVRDSLQEELAWLSNKVIAGDGIDFSSEDRVRHGIERARCYVSLGLESLCGGDLEKARDFLTHRWLELIFRWGVTHVLRERDRVYKITREYWASSQVKFLGFLNGPYDSLMQGLVRSFPEYYDPEGGRQTDQFRDFKRLQDIKNLETAVSQIEKIHVWMKHHLPSVFNEVLSSLGENGELTLFSVLGTAFVNFTMRAELDAAPIKSADTLKFVKQAFESRGTARVIQPLLKENFLNRFFNPDERCQLQTFWALVFEAVEEELGRLDPEGIIEPEFISVIRLENRTPGKAKFRPVGAKPKRAAKPRTAARRKKT